MRSAKASNPNVSRLSSIRSSRAALASAGDICFDRGPQGTLYGASTMGGLLKYALRSPDLDLFEGRAGVNTSSIKSADGDEDENEVRQSGGRVALL
jgi:outer membrane receptor protein involved in Fe transport